MHLSRPSPCVPVSLHVINARLMSCGGASTTSATQAMALTWFKAVVPRAADPSQCARKMPWLAPGRRTGSLCRPPDQAASGAEDKL
jgi:hypothetical protein